MDDECTFLFNCVEENSIQNKEKIIKGKKLIKNWEWLCEGRMEKKRSWENWQISLDSY